MKIKTAIILLMLLTMVQCTDEKKKSTIPSDKTDDFEKICIEGHIYYEKTKTFGYAGYGYLSIKLDDNGKPMKCYQ